MQASAEILSNQEIGSTSFQMELPINLVEKMNENSARKDCETWYQLMVKVTSTM